MIILPILTTSLIHFSSKGWEDVLFEIGSERVKNCVPPSQGRVRFNKNFDRITQLEVRQIQGPYLQFPRFTPKVLQSIVLGTQFRVSASGESA